VGTKDLKRVLTLLRDCGVTHFKSGDLEITLGPAPVKTALPRESASKPALTVSDDGPEDIENLLFFHEAS
jgi:hypothetical protein